MTKVFAPHLYFIAMMFLLASFVAASLFSPVLLVISISLAIVCAYCYYATRNNKKLSPKKELILEIVLIIALVLLLVVTVIATNTTDNSVLTTPRIILWVISVLCLIFKDIWGIENRQTISVNYGKALRIWVWKNPEKFFVKNKSKCAIKVIGKHTVEITPIEIYEPILVRYKDMSFLLKVM